MEAKSTKAAHLYAIAVSGAYAYEGEIRKQKDTTAVAAPFAEASALPIAKHSNQRDTLLAILAALDKFAELYRNEEITHVYVRTNIKGYESAWSYNHPYWVASGIFVRKDNTPIANADLWAKILEHHKRVPLTLIFQAEGNTPGGMRMRTLKLRAASLLAKSHRGGDN